MTDKKRILVTGAGGYIGRHVVAVLLDRGMDVCAVDLDTSQIDPRADKLAYNIFAGDEDVFCKLGQPDACLHMAWKDGFIHNADSHLLHLPDHYVFLRNMLQGGLTHLAVMGTMHEVGYFEGAIDEATPTNPLSMYGIAKNTLRQVLTARLAATEVKFQWLRAFYIVGDDLKNNSIFSKITKLALAGEKTFPFTTGEKRYDFISVQELASQIASAIGQTEVCGIINCCSGQPRSLRDKVEEFIRHQGFSIQPQYGAFPERAYDSPAIWGDATKIRQILRLDPRVE